MSFGVGRAGTLGLPLVLLVGLLLSGCSASDGRLKVPTESTIGGTDGDMAALQGRLEGAQNPDGSACFWVDGPNGRAFLVTRDGSFATTDLRLHEQDAQVVAEVGKDYLFSGAPGYDQRTKGCSGTGVVWYTGQIQPAHPDYTNATLPPRKAG